MNSSKKGFGIESTFSELTDHVTVMMTTFVASAESMITTAGVYVIYCIIWLVHPLHLNVNQKAADRASEIYNPLKYLWIRRDVDKKALKDIFDSKKEDKRENLQERVYSVLRVYFALKVMMNGLYAACNFALFWYLNLDLTLVLTMLCFLLSFIPELGTMICFVVPLPIVLLQPGSQDRMKNFLVCVIGQNAIKMVVSNILESIVMGRAVVLMGGGMVKEKDINDLKETHPAIIIFAVVFMGKVWGATGMLLCVPMLSLIRLLVNAWSYEAEAMTPRPSQNLESFASQKDTDDKAKQSPRSEKSLEQPLLPKERMEPPAILA